MPTLIDKLKIKVQKINFFSFNNGGRLQLYKQEKVQRQGAIRKDKLTINLLKIKTDISLR